MNNIEMINALREIKAACDADQHGGMMNFARHKMIELGFFDTMPESSFDPFRPCPADWSAMQVAVFDNGEQAKPRRKRSYIERTKMRYGGQIKVWTRDEINFKAKSQISWRSNFYLWDHTIAVQVANELLNQKLINQSTLDMMEYAVNEWGSERMYAIPVLKTQQAGSRWMHDHLLLVELENGALGQFQFLNNAGLAASGSKWTETDPSGRELDDKVLGQLRIATSDGFSAWVS